MTSQLQRIQNYAARVILRLPMSSSITIHLKSLHWLPVKERSTYKIARLCCHCHSSTAPSYVTDMLHKKPLHTCNTRSSSYTMPLLNRPAHSKATLGDRTCYFELRRLASIRRFLTSTATATLVSAFVLSRIDYCNSLLFGSTHDVTSHLQRIQNYAARVILRLPMSSRITIHLKSLHWLPVKVRSTYKIACLCNHCHSSTAPSYVTDMLHKKPLHTRSSSYTMPLLNRPAHSKATLGDRLFSFASSSVWNSIPNDVRCAPSLSSFKSRLKTYLFRSVYKD